MPPPACSHARRYPRAPLLILLALALAAGAAGAASAQPAPGVTALSRDDALRSGMAVGIIRRPDLHPELVEVRVPGDRPHARLLAVAPGGASAAVADRLDLGRATLTLADADGSQLRIPMRGLLGAAFAPDASWLAVVDGRGALWRVAVSSGAAEHLADGPFLGPITFDAGGSLILASVSSVEAPFISRLVRVDPADGSWTGLSSDGLVYSSSLLADGTLAVVVHEPGTTVVRRLAVGAGKHLADLGAGAIHVAISADGSRIAWERHGEGVFLLDRADGGARRIGSGSHPRFSPDGEALLVHDGEGTVLLAADGAQIARLGGPAAFVRCDGECGS